MASKPGRLCILLSFAAGKQWFGGGKRSFGGSKPLFGRAKRKMIKGLAVG
ncbi:hypothetical protein [Alloprevotella tannerae]|nr:hypothetical protein [Alloprevotella tannerae]